MVASSATFGDLLRRYRLAAGLTQEGLAERAQVSPRAISDLERGARSRPWRETIQLLAAALKLSAAELAGLETAAHAPLPLNAAKTTRTAEPFEVVIAPTSLPAPFASLI